MPWDFLDPDQVPGAGAYGGLPHGTLVTIDGRVGVVSFTRSGFARVRWLDDGTMTEEWAGDLTVVEGET